MKDILMQSIPRPIIFIMRKSYFSLIDIFDILLGRRNEDIPPRRMIFIGGGDFVKIGKEFFHYFYNLGNLSPNAKILDIGCGIGRMALPLTRFLKDGGEYQGFDIVPRGIKWCQRKITPKYTNFHFRLADIYNKRYNPKGKFKATDWKFPYEDDYFDFIFLTSVFSHMHPQDVENYLSEIARVLKRGKRCLITYFLLNTESVQLIASGQSVLKFKYAGQNYRTTRKKEPESAVSFSESFIRSLYNKYGLNILDPIHYGSWCRRKNFLSYQDIIIAVKQ